MYHTQGLAQGIQGEFYVVAQVSSPVNSTNSCSVRPFICFYRGLHQSPWPMAPNFLSVYRAIHTRSAGFQHGCLMCAMYSPDEYRFDNGWPADYRLAGELPGREEVYNLVEPFHTPWFVFMR